MFNLFNNKKDALRTTLKNNPLLVDVRTRVEFLQGSVEGAVNIPLDNIENNIAKFKSKPSVVVFCRSGGRASAAVHLLHQHGVENVTNGGSWQDVRDLLKQL